MINKHYEAKRKADKHLHFNFIITNASDGTFELNKLLRKKINSWNVVEAPTNLYEMMRAEDESHLRIQKDALDLIRKHASSIKNYGYLVYNFNKSAPGSTKYLLEPSIVFIYDYRENKNLEYILHCARYNSTHPNKIYCIDKIYSIIGETAIKIELDNSTLNDVTDIIQNI